MTNEESTKIVNFMTPGTGVSVLGHGHLLKIKCIFLFSCLHWDMDQTKVYSYDD